MTSVFQIEKNDQENSKKIEKKTFLDSRLCDILEKKIYIVEKNRENI